jgi:NADH-quinone oxidoreductase subunit E
MGTTLNSEIDLTLMDQVFDKYAGQRGVLIPILQAAQSAYSYLPAEVLQLIADKLGTSLGRVYGVATFYAQFYLERRGKHILKLCDGTACHVKGTSILLTAVEDEFGISPGETSDDGELTVEIVYCLGSCALAPVAVVDEQVVGRVRKDILLQRVKRRIEDAQASAGALV